MEPDKAASIMYVDEGYTEGLDCNQPANTPHTNLNPASLSRK